MRLLSYIINYFRPHRHTNTIDTSGVVWSDYPHGNGNGYNKGWLLNTPSRDVVVICKHANPSVGGKNNEIFVRDRNKFIIRRKIIKIDNASFDIGSTDKYYNGGDIALCKLDAPLPLDVRAYNMYTNTRFIYGLKIATLHQDLSFSEGSITHRGKVAHLRTRNRTSDLTPGDSGLPWFAWDDDDKEWKVVTHSFRGDHGEGPWYAMIADEIMIRAQTL